MATIAAAITPPLLTTGENPSDMSLSSEEEEEDPEELIPFADDPIIAPPQSPQLEKILPPAVPLRPLFIDSLAEMKDLSDAISSFQQCYDDLHNHLDSIKAAILSKLPPETSDIIALAPSSSSKPDISEETILQKQQQQQQQQERNSSNSELEDLCKLMCSRGIRKYLATHLPRLPKLRKEVPMALKLAPNPPKLVLECLGKFYLQGSKAFTRDSPMIPAREASILILECFLLMLGMDSANVKDNGAVNIEKAVRGEAETAALAWRKRLLFEGGLAKANQIDARGLLLFVACFGIPSLFNKEDIRDLVITANAKEIVGVLEKSHVLMNKIPEIVEGMMKNKMEVGAVDIVYTFGLEERFNPHTILMQFLRESKESWKKPWKGSSEATLNDANKNYLSALKSVSKCLERHKIDPVKLLSGWQINEKIASLQKEITESDRKSRDITPNKRKANENETWKRPKPQELPKRPRYVDHGQHKQNAAAAHVVDSRRNLLDSGHPNHTNNYHPSPAVLYGGPSAVSHGSILSTPSYGGVNGGMMVDTAGQLINHGARPYDWRVDSALVEKYASQASGQPSSLGLTNLYRASTSVEVFAGGVANASSVGHGNRAAQSDLYQFADAVAENESYRSGAAAAPTAVHSHYSSYLYQV